MQSLFPTHSYNHEWLASCVNHNSSWANPTTPEYRAMTVSFEWYTWQTRESVDSFTYNSTHQYGGSTHRESVTSNQSEVIRGQVSKIHTDSIAPHTISPSRHQVTQVYGECSTPQEWPESHTAWWLLLVFKHIFTVTLSFETWVRKRDELGRDLELLWGF